MRKTRCWTTPAFRRPSDLVSAQVFCLLHLHSNISGCFPPPIVSQLVAYLCKMENYKLSGSCNLWNYNRAFALGHILEYNDFREIIINQWKHWTSRRIKRSSLYRLLLGRENLRYVNKTRMTFAPNSNCSLTPVLLPLPLHAWFNKLTREKGLKAFLAELNDEEHKLWQFLRPDPHAHAFLLLSTIKAIEKFGRGIIIIWSY